MAATTFLAIFIAYLLGSIPTGYLVARARTGIDIRTVGDRSIGTTNVFQEVGRRWGIVTLVGDFLKGAAAMLVARWLPVSDWELILVAVAVVAGHTWPLFLHFRGGAGLVAALGTVFVVLPREMLLLLLPLLLMLWWLRAKMHLGLVVGLFLIPFIILSWALGESRALVALPAVVGLTLVVRKYGWEGWLIATGRKDWPGGEKDSGQSRRSR